MRIAAVVILSVGLGAGSVLAQGAPPAKAPEAAPTPLIAPEAKTAKARAKENIAECLRMWDAGTHMTKQQWARTCERIQSRLESLSIENLEPMGTALRKKRG
jgi:hypothetical protein